MCRTFLVATLAFLLSPLPLTAQLVDVWSRPVQTERTRTHDFIHYRISLTFDLDNKVFWGENRITLTPFADGLGQFEVDAEEIIIEAATGPRGEELPFQRTDTSVIVSLPDPPDYGDTIQVTLAYRGENPQEGFFFDDASDDHPQMVSTDSWPNEAHHWIPLYDYPNDKVTHDLIFTVPAGNKVLSNGRLVGVTEDAGAGTTTWHWAQERPHSTYLMMLAIGPFARIEDSLGDLPIAYWVYPEAEEDARWIFEKTPRMIAFYSDLFDYPYPWAKYDQVTTPHVGGGAEATSATILGDGVIHDRKAEKDFSWERIIAHEIAHQWWGDLITLREWSHTWLNESFGTYSDYLWTRAEKGEEEGAWDLLGKKNQYLREARERYIRPIVFDRYDLPGDNFDSHTYPKGACILHQLRYILGDEPFFRTLSVFLHEYAFQPVDTHDFMRTVKEVTGRNMDWFFDQFIFLPGHPVFEVTSDWDAEAGEIWVHVTQVQSRDHGVPIYETPLRIGIVTPSGKRVEEVRLEEEHHSFSFPSSEKPLLVRFDEGNWLLKEWSYEKSLDELLFQARNDDVIGREWAVRRLADVGGDPAGDPAVAEVLTDLASGDPFWAVRVAALEALGTQEQSGEHRSDAPAVFREAAADPDSRVRRTAVRLLGALGDAALNPFFRDRFRQDDSYLVQAEALTAIGRTGDRGYLPFLREALGIPSHQDVIRRAAEQAIEQLSGRR